MAKELSSPCGDKLQCKQIDEDKEIYEVIVPLRG